MSISTIMTFKSAILAGIFISIGAIAYLSVGGVIGAILFTFGLISVLYYKLNLFTGKAGFVNTKEDFKNLLITLFGNIIGCTIMVGLVKFGFPDLTANLIIEKRLNNSLFSNFILSIFCGIIMTTAVKFGREDKWLATLFGIPLFISCGFIHSIADVFYYILSPESFKLLLIYPIIVIGNFIGCNLYRICDTIK